MEFFNQQFQKFKDTNMTDFRLCNYTDKYQKYAEELDVKKEQKTDKFWEGFQDKN